MKENTTKSKCSDMIGQLGKSMKGCQVPQFKELERILVIHNGFDVKAVMEAVKVRMNDKVETYDPDKINTILIEKKEDGIVAIALTQSEFEDKVLTARCKDKLNIKRLGFPTPEGISEALRIMGSSGVSASEAGERLSEATSEFSESVSKLKIKDLPKNNQSKYFINQKRNFK